LEKIEITNERNPKQHITKKQRQEEVIQHQMQTKTNRPTNKRTNHMVGKKAQKNQKSERGKTTNTGDVSEGNYGRYKKGGNGLQATSSL
jgi:hypothetical protein